MWEGQGDEEVIRCIEVDSSAVVGHLLVRKRRFKEMKGARMVRVMQSLATAGSILVVHFLAPKRRFEEVKVARMVSLMQAVVISKHRRRL